MPPRMISRSRRLAGRRCNGGSRWHPPALPGRTCCTAWLRCAWPVRPPCRCSPTASASSSSALSASGMSSVDDEGLHAFARDAGAAGQLLELLVGVGHGVAAHHGLDRLGQQFPVGVEIGLQQVGVDFQLAQALQQRVVAEQRRSRGRRPCCAARWSRSGRAASGRSAASRPGASARALARPRLPSEFSKSIGLTLCGMVDEPISPALTFCLKKPSEM